MEMDDMILVSVDDELPAEPDPIDPDPIEPEPPKEPEPPPNEPPCGSCVDEGAEAGAELFQSSCPITAPAVAIARATTRTPTIAAATVARPTRCSRSGPPERGVAVSCSVSCSNSVISVPPRSSTIRLTPSHETSETSNLPEKTPHVS